MNILDSIIERNREKKTRDIAIGIGDSEISTGNILDSADSLSRKLGCNIFIIGTPQVIKKVQNRKYSHLKPRNFISSETPGKFLMERLFESSSNLNQENYPIKFDAVIRGSLGSSNFLKIVRNMQNIDSQLKELINIEKVEKTFRLALLESAFGTQFFYAPVGIDEANYKEDKLELINNIILFFNKMEIPPKISLLSGGRKGDLGRDAYIDHNIHLMEQLTQELKKKYPNISLNHDYILIEKAIKNSSNVIIAPEGISGNLIYRTLVHLGCGMAYGAIYLNIFNQTNKIIIDTSRVAEKTEYEGAIYLANYL